MTRFPLLFVLAFTVFSAQAINIVPSPPQVAAKSYILIDATSGEVLVEHNADLPLPPASLTKLMTSYVLTAELASGRVSRGDMVVVSENAWSQNPLFKGSSLMWIEPGKNVSIEDLHRGIVVSSGNDATVAVAEHLAGNESAFADMMNGYAEALGMQDSWFINSHGLPHPDHVTTARDLAILSQALITRYPEEYSLYKEPEFSYNNITTRNRNTLMGEDASVDGLKTGHTEAAGYCLVASAERRGMRLISVVMGTNSKNARKNETRSLLNYGFRFFETVTVYEPMAELDKPRIWKGQQDYLAVGLVDAVTLTLPRGKKKNLETVVEVNPDIMAPIALGDRLGKVKLVSDGETVFESPLVALESVEPGSFFARLWDWVLMFVASLFTA
ncbi:MAG: D-alanyl-D-alanine carboxypeptidase family protein [Halioglobus sp.]